jgi:hypothetical protein
MKPVQVQYEWDGGGKKLWIFNKTPDSVAKSK